jgi:hypothetical protein
MQVERQIALVAALRQRLQWKSFLRRSKQKDWNEKRVCRPKYFYCTLNIANCIKCMNKTVTSFRVQIVAI